MDPDDIPASVADKVYLAPLADRLSQNDVKALICHLWPAIEQHVREQIAADLLAVDPVDWALAGQHAGKDAARIARGINPNT